MHIRSKLISLIPEKPRQFLQDLLHKAFYLEYGFTLEGSTLATYSIKGAKPALWSADTQEPYGVFLTEFSFPHFLLVRTIIRTCNIHSWCDLGTGSATLLFQAARLGISNILGIDGADSALLKGTVWLPLNNYFVADVTLPLEVSQNSGEPACFDVVSALELIEHIPDNKLECLFDNIRRLDPKYVVFTIGLQPDPPYHVNLKSMAEWQKDISSMLPDWTYDDALSVRIFHAARCHDRFINNYHTNHLPLCRNLVIFVRQRLPV